MAVVGDSIAVMLAEAWGSKVPVVEAEVGISSSASVRVVGPVLSSLESSGLTVVSLGTNDGLSTVGGFPSAIESVLRAAPSCVAWLTIYRVEGDSSWEPFNGVLRAASERYQRLVLVDWASMAAGNPDYLYPDGVHPTPAGVKALAAEVARAAASCPA